MCNYDHLPAWEQAHEAPAPARIEVSPELRAAMDALATRERTSSASAPDDVNGDGDYISYP
jgi:hypothetical protein